MITSTRNTNVWVEDEVMEQVMMGGGGRIEPAGRYSATRALPRVVSPNLQPKYFIGPTHNVLWKRKR